MVYCLSRSQPPFSTSAWETNDGPDRPVVIENPWAERESNPHSQRRLIYSQRSSPHCSICPRWVRYIQFYRPRALRGRSAHDAKRAWLHDLDIDNRLCAIDEYGTAPHLVDLHLEPERGPIARLDRRRDRLRDPEHDLGGTALPCVR